MKPIFEKMIMIKDKLDYMILNDKNVINVELEVDDTVADYDYIITFENNSNVKNVIYRLIRNIEDSMSYITVKILDDQIENGIKDNEEDITVDFYCNIKLNI